MTTLAIDGLGKTYADGTEALRDMHIMARSGEIVAILGGSGCGKTTLLRLTAGLDQPSAGVIAIDGQPIGGTHPAISAVFQEPRLLPWLTVGRNIAFGGRRIAKPERQRRVANLLGRIGLAGYGARWPKDLSGGQQQRVAIARALASRPAIIFADEPTGNLDSRASAEVLGLLRSCVGEFGQTVVMVTHDPVAASHSDRVVFLADGRVAGALDDPAPEAVLHRMRALGEPLPVSSVAWPGGG
jgi:sulfonate transport system ATP-binding protein